MFEYRSPLRRRDVSVEIAGLVADQSTTCPVPRFVHIRQYICSNGTVNTALATQVRYSETG